jgi:hypothetical protein
VPEASRLRALEAQQAQQAVPRHDRHDVLARNGHSPAFLGPYVTSALDMTFSLPGQPVPVFPGQADLEAIRAQLIRNKR